MILAASHTTCSIGKIKMSSHFLNIIKQAFKTFDRGNTANFTANLHALKQLTNVLTYKDFHINQSLLQDAAFARADCAPCTFIQIFENDIMSLSVFILKSGYTMPLHDHPQMNGLLKCIYGELLVQSYTQISHPYEPHSHRGNTRSGIPVIREEPLRLGTQNECAQLSPIDRNFHEITAHNGVAAFFDILSPPYDADIPLYGRRRCQFYVPKVDGATKLKPLTMKLLTIPAPGSYYCDIAETPVAVCNSIKMCSENEGEAKDLQ